MAEWHEFQVELDKVAEVMKALTPFVEPYAGPLWERFALTFYVKSTGPGTVRFDNWNLTKARSVSTEEPPVLQRTVEG